VISPVKSGGVFKHPTHSDAYERQKHDDQMQSGDVDLKKVASPTSPASPSVTDDNTEVKASSEKTPGEGRLVLKHSPNAIAFNNDDDFLEKVRNGNENGNRGQQ
jgi:hypothetical protein